MKISVIIISYNVCAYLRQCLKSVSKSTGNAEYEVIVIDNNSIDTSVEMVQQEFPQVKLIGNTENTGFSKAVNQAVKIANGDFICLLNPDCVIKTDTLSVLSDYLTQNADVGVVGCKVLNSDGSLQLASRRTFPKLVVTLPRLFGLHRIFPKNRIFGKYNLTHIDDNVIQDTDAVSGSCMMFSRTTVETVGQFDERFFLYFEDTDFCYRVKKSGYRVVYNPDTQIIHYKGESTKFARSVSEENFHQSAYLFFKKYSHEFPLWNVFRLFVWIAIGFRKVGSHLFTHKSSIISWFLDSSLVLMAFYGSMAFWYPHHFGIPVSISYVAEHWKLWTTYLIIWHAVAIWLSLYKKNNLSYGRPLVVSAISFIGVSTVTYFISVFAYSRVVLLFTFLISAFLQAMWRIIVHLFYRQQWIRVSHVPPFFTRNAIILGNPAAAANISKLLDQSPSLFYKVLGVICDQFDGKRDPKIKYLGPVRQLCAIAKQYQVNEIIILEESYSVSDIIEQIQALSGMNIVFKFVPDGHHYLIGKGVVDNIGGIPLVGIDFPLFDRLHLFAKRIFDTILSLLMILLTLPIHIYLWILMKAKKVKIWSPDHIGIQLLEFDVANPLLQKLPYLYSIFVGKISFVGSEVVDYSKPDPGIIIKPGITGLSQLKNGSVQDANNHFEQYYIQNQNLVFDLEILLKSILRI